MFKAIHRIAPTYLSDRIVMNFDVNGYDTRGSDMEWYLPTLGKSHFCKVVDQGQTKNFIRENSNFSASILNFDRHLGFWHSRI